MSPEYQNQEPHVFAAEASSAEGAGTVRVATPTVAEAEATPEVAETAFSTDDAANLAENPEQPGEQSRDVPHEEPQEQTPETIQQAADKPVDTPMEQLIEQYAVPQAAPAGGEIFDGRVIAVTDLGVVVDVGAKFEGLVPAQEFLDTGGIHFQSGDSIAVERLPEQKDGYVLLSHVRAHRRRVWEQIEKSHKEGLTLAGKVVDRIKGGLVVDIGIRAFLPASQLDLRPVHDLEAWKDRELECRVLKLNRKRGNVVVSRRVILEEEQRKQREAFAETLSEGSIVTGKVKNITEYGVFVDLGGLDGLLHISDLVWGRIAHPSEAVSAGQEIQVQILKFDKEKMRISLGRKQLLPDPWVTVPERFPVGTHLRGKVVGLADYGAFVHIEAGVEGLVHVSEMSWSKRLKHPSKMVKVGDEVEVVVLELKPEQRRISLGLKQTSQDPWAGVAEKYVVGSVVSGRVRNLADFGAFVELEEGIEGLIHVSDLSWTERVKHPSEKLKKGDTVEAKVLKIDGEHRRISLGLKQVNDIWANWFAEHKLNEVLKGKVVRNAAFGAFVELAEGIEALCHISEIEERRPKGESGDRSKQKTGKGSTAALVQGKEYEFKIIRLDPEQRKISLSYRAAQKQVERRDIEVFRSSKSSPNATIGDAIMAKRQAN
ncbi:MAG: 30S ribosomal protein S1 [Candidatus Acidiferrales bacterium]|jgi:small subunit ribosomal protein S1|nr:30S ribosomal protein S1 [Candidatus Acidoferrales bacterium]